MSNHFAIATVTATLQNLLEAAVGAELPGAHASIVRPEKGAAGLPDPGVNIFLYQVSPNPAWRNEDLPTRRGDGQMLQRPRVGIDLNYLLTFYGSDTDYQPQLVLGTVLRELHAKPVLTRQQIEDVVTPGSAVWGSNLADQIELVKFTQMPISLEELSKLWSVLWQTTYQLSIVYQGTVVLLDTDDVVSRALPVRLRRFYVETLRVPRVDSVVAAVGDDRPILSGADVLIRGQGLWNDSVNVLVDGRAATVGAISDTEITATLPAIPAGVHGLVVEHPRVMGAPLLEVPHPAGVTSAVVAFVLAPAIRQPTPGNYDLHVTGTTIEMTVDPVVGVQQKVTVALNEQATTDAHAYMFDSDFRSADTNSLSFPTSGVSPGNYLVRVQVDGADSPLELSSGGTYSAPSVTL